MNLCSCSCADVWVIRSGFVLYEDVWVIRPGFVLYGDVLNMKNEQWWDDGGGGQWGVNCNYFLRGADMPMTPNLRG
ncbi:hypothetical protein Hanom_Chr12g01075341 [Helianthus anomalus]